MTFPNDYEARCMYAACAVEALIHDTGEQATLTGGNMLVFTLSGAGDPPVAQGFGGGDVRKLSHFWVESDSRIIDLGPNYLPRRSARPILAMPMIAWKSANTLPNYLYYRSLTGGAPAVQVQHTPETAERMAKFLAKCRRRYASPMPVKMRTWVLTGEKSLVEAAKRGDHWAIGARRFQSRQLNLVPPEIFD